MNTATNRWSHGDLLIPNELERRQVFYLLKKSSSYTAWKRALGYYEKWAEITENSIREADNSGLLAANKTTIVYSHYVDILKSLALFDKGVTRLGQGDKRVFTYSEENGFFVRASSETRYWETLRYKAEHGDSDWKETTPYGEEFYQALDDLCNARSENGRYVIEGRLLNSPARLNYHMWHAVFLPRLPYPDPLPEVPEPKEPVIVRTGELIPYSGIWEPLDENTSRLIGMMNYLHGNTNAPPYEKSFVDHSVEIHGYGEEIIHVAWRLIWRDDRYEDGTVPEEEKSYIFVRPVPKDAEDPYDADPLEYIRKHNLPHPFLANRRQVQDRVEGGQPCPKEGFWWSPANKSKGRIFKKGEIMPIVESTEYGICYWLWGGKI